MINKVEKKEYIHNQSTERGHVILFIDGNWVYEDTGEVSMDIRPCKRCGRHPTKEGYDACLGHIEGVKSACCGHGLSKPIMVPGVNKTNSSSREER